MLKSIQIVSFDNPYPPNFGGVIDVYYKIKALADKGVKVYLHYFYTDRTELGPLENYCEKIYPYKRNVSAVNFFHWLPYRIKSRQHKMLYTHLTNIDAPIFFEGLHSTSVLKNHSFKQPIYVRVHNIEHEYTLGLAKSESYWLNKMAHFIESKKLRHYQSVLNKADRLFALSKYDCEVLLNKTKVSVSYLPAFHGNNISDLVKESDNDEKFALYHGDLSSSSNVKSVEFLVQIFKTLNYQFVIASSTESKRINAMIAKLPNCIFLKLNSKEQLKAILVKAHVNVLYSNVRSGTKLKVFNALYRGKHVIVNNNIVDDKNILDLCMVANDKNEFIENIHKTFNTNYVLSEERIRSLKKYSTKENIELLLRLFKL